MIDPDSIADPIRQTHNDNTVRLARWRSRSRKPIRLYTHVCEQCDCELRMTHADDAETVCPVCNEYRVFRVHESKLDMWKRKARQALKRFNDWVLSL